MLDNFVTLKIIIDFNQPAKNAVTRIAPWLRGVFLSLASRKSGSRPVPICTTNVLLKVGADKLSHRTHFLKPPQAHSDAFFILAANRHTLHAFTSLQAHFGALKSIFVTYKRNGCDYQQAYH
ncbi:TPA: hypothetical protein ACQZHI_003858, partial [Escherichia coli]